MWGIGSMHGNVWLQSRQQHSHVSEKVSNVAHFKLMLHFKAFLILRGRWENDFASNYHQAEVSSSIQWRLDSLMTTWRGFFLSTPSVSQRSSKLKTISLKRATFETDSLFFLFRPPNVKAEFISHPLPAIDKSLKVQEVHPSLALGFDSLLSLLNLVVCQPIFRFPANCSWMNHAHCSMNEPYAHCSTNHAHCSLLCQPIQSISHRRNGPRRAPSHSQGQSAPDLFLAVNLENRPCIVHHFLHQGSPMDLNSVEGGGCALMKGKASAATLL